MFIQRLTGLFKIISLILFISLVSGNIFPLEENNLDEEKTNSYIDWSSYQYNILSYININKSVSINERYYMRNQVKEIVLKKISSSIENMYVDNSHKIMDILDDNINFRREYPLYLQSINVVRMTFRDSMIEASTTLPLRGGRGLLTHIPLPWGTMTYNSLNEPEYVGEAYNKSRVSNEYEAGLVPLKYSGVIIDLRGMEINEALAPRIFSQTGQLIYGPEFVMHKIGVQRGIIAYAYDMTDYEVKVRAGDSAYYTVALSTKGVYKTDVVISNQDAGRLMQHAVTLENLQKCRVVFLVDKKK
ncbi:MAG: hypothetical protein OEV78_09930 [Spirochaetia bacterium]|nr:hypothetical protein [Spirochaetia bacterium]